MSYQKENDSFMETYLGWINSNKEKGQRNQYNCEVCMEKFGKNTNLFYANQIKLHHCQNDFFVCENHFDNDNCDCNWSELQSWLEMMQLWPKCFEVELSNV